MILNESKTVTHKFKCTKCKYVFDYNYGELPKDCNAVTYCPKCASLARLNESQKIDESVDLKSIKKGDWVVAGGLYTALAPIRIETVPDEKTFKGWAYGKNLNEYLRGTIRYVAKSEKDAIEWINKNKRYKD